MDRDRTSRRARDDDYHHRSRDRDDDRHRRRSRHEADDHHKQDGGDDDRRRRHREKDGGGGDDEDRRHRRDRDRDDRRGHRHRDGGDDDRRRESRRSVSPADSPPPSAKRGRSGSRPRESVERRDSADREPAASSSRKRKGHEGGGGGGGDEADHEGGKRARASVDPPPPKEERPRRERRKFEDADANGKNGDVRNKEILTHEQKNGEFAVNGDLQSGARANAGSQQPLNATPVSSSVTISSKVSSITTNNENEGVSIRSDEVTGKSSTDGSATSAAGKSSNLSLDALAKAKKALQLKKELSEKLKRLPMLNNKLGKEETKTSVSAVDAQPFPNEETKPTGVVSSLPISSVSGTPATVGQIGIPGLPNIPNLDAVKRAQELAAKMGFRQDPQFAPLINLFPGTSSELTVPQRPPKAPVLRLDAQGREIDEQGNVISMTKPVNLSTLKVNINKQKKEAFQIIKPDLDSLAKSSAHFDERMGINQNKLLRPKRPGFQFIEEGKLTRQAELQKIKSQFGEAQAKELRVKQAQLAKAKVEVDMNPNLIEVASGVRAPKQKQKEEIPDIEPWDSKILLSGTYDDMEKLNTERITIYVEHPEPYDPPAEPAPPPPQPLKLTKKEQKKLRTQRRLAKEKDRQEMIRQGLLEPPKPKVKMSNLMKVLGSEAVQDPTRLEMEIRTAAAEREQAHVDRNIARKLTPSERREKKERKLFDDPTNTVETIVCVYKIRDLSHPQTRFKVDVNAQENRLTGAAVITDTISVVVVEGGKKSIKRYNKLMLNRIDWASAVGDDDADEESDKPVNSCVLVWQGTVAKPTFHRFTVHNCRSEAAAKKVFIDASVSHYWDLAVNFSEDSS
ncbi:hypothetical protein U9M48_019975 [Paspalum notatum var. saurae]|uniref:Uncharacterized protein n=1 Tax=Paspalum notatum var. saurae TaxID=547442 RepID=A0AAQ3WR79_PASNO